MKNYYYLIWVDAIVGFRKHNPERSDWKISLFIINTTCNALNLWVIYIWLKYFGVISYLIQIDFFPIKSLNSATAFFIQFGSPFIILNYFLIFFNERYKKLIKKYPNKNGRLAMIYTVSSALIGFISMILYGTLT